MALEKTNRLRKSVLVLSRGTTQKHFGNMNGESFDLVSFLQGSSGRVYEPDQKHTIKAEVESWAGTNLP
jgi:hypothetical protein